ncbi:MAG: hypothetical protein PHH36_04515, partial [Sideroxydans sp.]|nr:hypothetical protein [Sideroxydans sp.]
MLSAAGLLALATALAGVNGVWEEMEEIHASSVGACVAGLRSISGLSFIVIPNGLIEKGEESLRSLLPRESKAKFCDLAQLSLIYPYGVVNEKDGDRILFDLK